MRVVVQRVASASVVHEGAEIAAIGKGLVLYIGVSKGEEPGAAEWLIQKIRGTKEAGDEVLCLSQFTLFAAFKGPKPSFHRAESPETARAQFYSIVEAVRGAFECKVANGIFGTKLEIKFSGSSIQPLVLER
ncbi:D-aminoacyl-tRNA deacylase [Pancytospora philotis]|nr:D-aminoacyl-tRNA deacylase [Pancytospora philotis]